MNTNLREAAIAAHKQHEATRREAEAELRANEARYDADAVAIARDVIFKKLDYMGGFSVLKPIWGDEDHGAILVIEGLALWASRWDGDHLYLAAKCPTCTAWTRGEEVRDLIELGQVLAKLDRIMETSTAGYPSAFCWKHNPVAPWKHNQERRNAIAAPAQVIDADGTQTAIGGLGYVLADLVIAVDNVCEAIKRATEPKIEVGHGA